MKCPDCPAAGACVVERTGHVAFCDWAATGDPARLARIVEMSAGVPDGDQAPVPRPSVDESVGLVRLMDACLYRSRRPGCCSGASCGLRGGSHVSHVDCFACLRAYGA